MEFGYEHAPYVPFKTRADSARIRILTNSPTLRKMDVAPAEHGVPQMPCTAASPCPYSTYVLCSSSSLSLYQGL